MKKWIALLLASLLLFAGCSQPAPTTEAKPAETEPAATESVGATEQKEFTVDELAKFNGKDGNRAYIAVDGVVYDVTDAPPWNGGDHNGYESGKDLTKEIKEDSPHGISKLEGIPVVGTLKQ